MFGGRNGGFVVDGLDVGYVYYVCIVIWSGPLLLMHVQAVSWLLDGVGIVVKVLSLVFVFEIMAHVEICMCFVS